MHFLRLIILLLLWYFFTKSKHSFLLINVLTSRQTFLGPWDDHLVHFAGLKMLNDDLFFGNEECLLVHELILDPGKELLYWNLKLHLEIVGQIGDVWVWKLKLEA